MSEADLKTEKQPEDVASTTNENNENKEESKSAFILDLYLE